MKKVDSLSQYKRLLSEVRQKNGKYLVSNSYMFIDGVQRYIDMGRFYYEQLAGGVVFYSDEETHYRCYFHLSPAGTVKLERKDKLLLAQLIYKKSKRAKEQILTEKIEEAGFRLQDQMDYIEREHSINGQKLKRLAEYSRKLLTEAHLVIRPPFPNEIGKLIEYTKHIEQIPYYQLPYCSPEEYELAAKENRLVCVVDQNGNLCAACFSEITNGSSHGWIAISPEYQKAYGIIALLNSPGREHTKKNGVSKTHGWIERNNTESIKYHKKLGFVWRDRVMEEWLLGDI